MSAELKQLAPYYEEKLNVKFFIHYWETVKAEFYLSYSLIDRKDVILFEQYKLVHGDIRQKVLYVFNYSKIDETNIEQIVKKCRSIMRSKDRKKTIYIEGAEWISVFEDELLEDYEFGLLYDDDLCNSDSSFEPFRNNLIPLYDDEDY